MKTAPTTLAAAEARIAALISPELEARALDELSACLGAEVFVRAARGPDGISYRAVPDRAIRLAAAVRIIEFSRGKAPTSLTLIQPPGSAPKTNSHADLVALLAQNPVLARQIIDAHIDTAKKVTATSAP